MEAGFVTNKFDAFYGRGAKVLILGTIPSPKSREQGFYYGHPRNRFWTVLADVLGEGVPQTVKERKDFLTRHIIALWDVLKSCEIKGASDVSIRNARPNDMNRILKDEDTNIQAIFVAGTKAAKLYKKLCLPTCGVEAIQLPSTSPANTRCSDEDLRKAYSQICKYVR